jgi:hypothetical protein
MRNKKLNILIEKIEKISGKKIILKEEFDQLKTADDLENSLSLYKTRNEKFNVSEVNGFIKLSNYKISKNEITLNFNNDKVTDKVIAEYNIEKDKYIIGRKNASGMQVSIDIDSKMSNNLRMLLVSTAQEAQEAFNKKKTHYNFGNVGEQGQESYLETKELGGENDSRTHTDSFGDARANY